MQTQPVSATSSVSFTPAGTTTPENNHAPVSPTYSPPPPDSARVEAAIRDANKAMKAIDASVQFEIDPETKLTVVRVVDTASNTVLRQMPTQEMLDIAQALDRMQGMLLSQKA